MKIRLYSAGIALLLLSLFSQFSHGQISAGSTLRYDTTGAPDPLTGCWFQSIGEGDVSLHYDKVSVPSKVEGKLFCPAFMIDWNLTMDYEADNTIGSVRLIPNMRAILFSEKDELSKSRGMLFNQEARRWFLFEETNVVERKADILPEEAKEHARFLSPDNKGYVNSLLSVAGIKEDWKNTHKILESSFAGCVLRRGPSGRLVLGVVSEPKSKIYLPPVIANISPEVYGEFTPQILHDLRKIKDKTIRLHPWPFNSSTNITVSNGPAKSLVAEGQVEFLILGWNMCQPNFGRGTRVRVQEGTTGILLVDAAGNLMNVESEGTYTYDGKQWKLSALLEPAKIDELERSLRENPDQKKTLVPRIEEALVERAIEAEKATFAIKEILPSEKQYQGNRQIVVSLLEDSRVIPSITMGGSRMFFTGKTAPTIGLNSLKGQDISFSGSLSLQEEEGKLVVLLEYSGDNVRPFVDHTSGGLRITALGKADIPSGHRTVLRFVGSVGFMDCTFVGEGDDLNRLTFALIDGKGLVYLRGKGKVIDKDGKEIMLSGS